MSSPFGSLVVPIDADRAVDGARALPTALALAGRAGLGVEVVTVAPTTEDPSSVEAILTERLAEDGGRISVTCVLDADPAAAITSFVADRPDALLVMATHARGVVAERLLGSVSEAVLGRAERPVLLVGPEVDRQVAGRPDTLVVGVGDAPRETIVAGVAAWQQTFKGKPPWLLDVADATASQAVARSRGDVLETGHVKALGRELEEAGVAVQWDVVHERRPADALVQYASGVEGAVLVVASERWTGPDRRRFGSVARTVAHRASCPVLVLPVAP